MQEQGTLRREGAAFIWQRGAIGGVVLGVIQIIISLLSLGSLQTILNVVIGVIVFFVIGLFAARQTGRVTTGALVGLVVGLIGGLIGRVLFVIIQLATNGAQITQSLNQQGLSPGTLTRADFIGIGIALILLVAIEVGLGAAIGALGGIVGRHQAPPVASTPIGGTQWTQPSSSQSPASQPADMKK
jgi:hypothetical protein